MTRTDYVAWPTFWPFEQEAFAVPAAKLRGMVRGDSPIESQVAAVRVLHKLSAIQLEIIKMLGSMGSLTARELEEAPSFAKLAPSTVRKRLSELKAMGRVMQDGRKDGMAKWRLV